MSKQNKDRLRATIERMEVNIYCKLMNNKRVPNTIWARYDKYVNEYNELCPQNTSFQLQTYGGMSKDEYTNKAM